MISPVVNVCDGLSYDKRSARTKRVGSVIHPTQFVGKKRLRLDPLSRTLRHTQLCGIGKIIAHDLLIETYAFPPHSTHDSGHTIVWDVVIHHTRCDAGTMWVT